MRNDNTWAIVYSAPEWGPQETVAVGDVRPGFDLRARIVGRALVGAKALVDPSRVVMVVLEQERPWWSALLSELPPGNIAEQPFDRGSAAGILLALMRIFQQDPNARIVLFCSDHVDFGILPAVREALGADASPGNQIQVFARSAGGDRITRNPILLRTRSEIGPDLDSVASLVLDPAQAQSTHDEQGALVATPVLLASAGALLALFQATHPRLVKSFLAALKGRSLWEPAALDELYPFLHSFDFYRDVLAAAPDRLAARRVGGAERARPAA